MPPGNRVQAMYALAEPFPANLGTEPCPSTEVPATVFLTDHVGGVAVNISSEKVVEICTPPGAAGVKFDQLIITRPVSGSTSANSLSAASRGAPPLVSSPFGLVAGITSNGPVQV